jgi:hypothetical protein
VDILDSEIEKSKQDYYGFLLIPCNIECDWQFVYVVQIENFLQFQGDHCKRVGVVALAGVEDSGNASDIAEGSLCSGIWRILP